MTLNKPIQANKYISFKRQLLNIVVVCVFSLAIFTSVISAWNSSQILRNNTIETGQQLTDNFAEQVVLALLTGSQENAQEAINRILGFQSIIAVSIYDQQKNLLFSSESTTSKSINQNSFLENPGIVDESSNDWVFSAPVMFVEDSDDTDSIELDEGGIQQRLIGYVFVNYSKSSLQQIQQSIFINNVVIASIIALVLTLLIRTVLQRMIKPLLALSNTMETAIDSGLYPKAQVQGASEVRQIAYTYNQLMTTLEQQNIALENSRNTLESEVEIRTQELVVARDSALTASRHKSEFLANISHELRTPLQAIIGYIDLVREDLELECMDSQADDLNKSIRSANHLLALINNILDLAKIEAGRMDLYIKPVNVRNLVDETVETILPIAKSNNNELIVIADKLSSTLLLDRQKLIQIFLNLLSNACKFTKDGTISFEVSNDSRFLSASISDTGIGIAQDKLQFIFEQFTQVDGSQTRQFEGTGLGMAITQNFCQLMGGTLTVESEINKGSVFRVKIPLRNGD